jgi:hypothetical protein
MALYVGPGRFNPLKTFEKENKCKRDNTHPWQQRSHWKMMNLPVAGVLQ